jgi:serine/threonine-protein kinase
MVLVPAGNFTIGMDLDQALAICEENLGDVPEAEFCEWYSFSSPAYTIYLDDFFIDQYEITNARYSECVEAGACNPPYYSKSETRTSYYGNSDYADYPVIYVSWMDAKSYCSWRGGRLPTEAEWEKAARGTDERIFPWGNNFDIRFANFCRNDCLSDTTPVGSYPEGVSPYGALDMSGNVWEWLQETFLIENYLDSEGGNSQEIVEEWPPIRGGSFGFNPYLRNATFRWGGWQIWDTSYNIGFRCAVSVE